MTAASPSMIAGGSSLIRVLSEMTHVRSGVPQGNFSLRLSELLDMSGSIRLAQLHARLPDFSAQSFDTSPQTIRGEFLGIRDSMVQTIRQSFVAERSIAIQNTLPRVNPDSPVESLSNFEPYQRFYTAHQREFEFRILALQEEVRGTVAGVSAAHARLVALDKAMGEMFGSESRVFLAQIPRLLKKRFDNLINPDAQRYRDVRQQPEHQHGNTDEPQNKASHLASVELFRQEMQQVLLAELEVRLMPVLGLIESLGESHSPADSV